MQTFKGKHDLWYDDQVYPYEAESKWLMYNMEWIIGVQCTAHSCSNALKWGLMAQTDPDKI